MKYELSNELQTIRNFGGIDADADNLLKTCFQNHDSYIAVRDMEAFLVLGKKGSGKTAIYKKLVTERVQDIVALGHTFDDYPWHHHDLQASTGVPEERRYAHSWKYLILIGLAKMLLNEDSSQPWSEESFESMQIIESFLVDSYGSRSPDMHQLFSPDKELKLRGGMDLSVLKVEGEVVKVRNLPPHIQEVNREIQKHIFRMLNPSIKYFVCFDELDLGFVAGDTQYSRRLIGLLLAARDLFVSSKTNGIQLNPAVFLRYDIFQDLRFEDKNKITENYSTSINWAESSGGLTLKDVMERRFSELLPRDEDAATHVVWDDVFDETKAMPGRQLKYSHIIDRTLLRPRDMIKFCNEILNSYNSQGAYGLIENDAIHSARKSYSDYLLNEIEDEIAKHVPNYGEYLEVIKTLGAEKFTKESFISSYEKRVNLPADPEKALSDLFAFSVISYLKPGGRGGGSEYVWRYKDSRARFDPLADSYRVHPGFKEALGLVR
jgi:hypothetical protein